MEKTSIHSYKKGFNYELRIGKKEKNGKGRKTFEYNYILGNT